VVMENDVISSAGKGQGEDFSKTMCGTGDEGERRHGGIINAPRFVCAIAQRDRSLLKEIGNKEPNISGAFG
jgi:hypothetical protein